VVNDGLISGFGRIDTGVLRNRYLGQIEVNAGETLLINASATRTQPTQDLAAVFINWGVIRVIGNAEVRADLEFDRAPVGPGEPSQAFQNEFLTNPALVGRRAGIIHVQYGNVRFGTGLENQGVLAITAGDNLVIGDVFNLPSDPMVDAGKISVSGNNTSVVFENDLINDGVLQISLGSTIDVLEDYFQDGPGVLDLTLGGEAFFPLTIAGDAFLDEMADSMTSLLKLSYVGPSLEAGDTFGLLSAVGDLTGVFHPLTLPLLGTDLSWSIDYDYTADTVTARVVSLTAIGVTGADFNGDGVVDATDLAIWEMNYGLASGATGLQGDADGDGDVDGDDYLEWLAQLGPVMPGSGSIAEGLANVPEPGGLALIAFGALLASACRQRRSTFALKRP
jgi:hypothetical protein